MVLCCPLSRNSSLVKQVADDPESSSFNLPRIILIAHNFVLSWPSSLPLLSAQLFQIEKGKWLILVGLVALIHLFCQSLMLPDGRAVLSQLPDQKNNVLVKGSESSKHSSVKVLVVDNPLKKRKNKKKMNGDGMDDDFDFVEDETLGNVNVDMEEGFRMQNDSSLSLAQLAKRSSGQVVSKAETSKILLDKSVTSGSAASSTLVVSSAKPLLIKSVVEKKTQSEVSTSDGSGRGASFIRINGTSDGEGHLLLRNNFASSGNSSSMSNKPVKKKMRCEMPPKTVTPINEMQQLLVRHRARSRAMRPKWSSERDQEILRAKLKIEIAPFWRMIRICMHLYFEMSPCSKGSFCSGSSESSSSLFLDAFTRGVGHGPVNSIVLTFNSRLATITSEMVPLDTRELQAWKICTKEHGDKAPYETRHHMEHCIKALCNADVTMGFKIGRDVSLPETYVRSARNPLRDLGGKPASQRHILAFYAGNMHGYLRPILLKYWRDKEPDMKILGPMPPGVASKMNYIYHMKSSKYCICPKGYEVNSPRVVEAIFYECVPVIISDNFVPPFFEVLNWDAISVIIAEKDIPNLRSILLSIPEEKYMDMQLGVRKVQQHFLWHAKPVKYDLFHMTLHSIWGAQVNERKVNGTSASFSRFTRRDRMVM
ncbi:putative glycosyltransferase [Sesamum angolense]|uniref:Glycosyltransferase n=1 Tax=Sesamum angolense TaxID=2727404 RepID=A0AAE1VY82_9LAMI|nr:putative glycosyltransferase [Sesamum angolense]